MGIKILKIPVKKEYFEQIKAGTKKEEYRLFKEYWRKRLENKNYDEVWITLGYPSKAEKNKILKFKYIGYIKKIIQHKEFGDFPVEIYSIKLKQRIYD